MATALRSPLPDAAPDRRAVRRHRVTLPGTLSVGADAPRAVTLSDLSDRGCRIERLAGLVGGATVSLGFGGYAPFDAVAIWTSPSGVGLRFDHPLHPALVEEVLAAARGRTADAGAVSLVVVRREERERLWYLRRPVTLRLGRESAAGVLCDLSSGGCRVETTATASTGTQLRIALQSRRPLPGEVRWAGDGALGVRFTTPLPPDTVRSIAERG